MNVFSFLIEAANRAPDSPACISASGTVTYRELLQESEKMRDRLVSHGLRPGMGLGLVADNGPEFIIGLFAGLACEAVVMPISPRLKEQELHRLLELIPLAAVLHDGSLAAKSRAVEQAQYGSFELLVRPKEFHCKVASGVPRAAVIRFTSGTTGTSKGVVLSHASVMERTQAAAEALSITSGTKVLWVLPMVHHFIVSILTYVRCSATLILPQSTNSRAILDAANRYCPDILYAFPAVIEELSRDTSNIPLPINMRIVSTSTGISPGVRTGFESRFGLPISQIYGLIEVGLPVGNLAPSSLSGDCVGVPMPGYEAAIIDSEGRSLPAGQIGRLAVKGPGMFDAYLAPYRPKAEVLHNGWFMTGDLAIQGYDGAITICGREKSVIHSGGEKVFPEEVEAVLNSYPGVRSSRVFGIEQTNLEETVVAEVLCRKGSEFDPAALRTYLSERLSAHKVPDQFVLVGSIPLTHTGKVVRAVQSSGYL